TRERGSTRRELALALLLKLHVADVAELPLANRGIRSLFILWPEEYRIALQHLQLEFDDVAGGGASDTSIPFPRLPLAYALAFVSLNEFSEMVAVAVFPDLSDEDKPNRPWKFIETSKPLRNPRRVEKFLRKAIEFDIDIAVDTRPNGFLLVAKLNSPALVELTKRMIDRHKIMQSARPRERTARRRVLERAAMCAACWAGSATVG
ncbi:hypothetical protein HDU96_002291, partial [Phlyctochytrium bullatum]